MGKYTFNATISKDRKKLLQEILEEKGFTVYSHNEYEETFVPIESFSNRPDEYYDCIYNGDQLPPQDILRKIEGDPTIAYNLHRDGTKGASILNPLG